MVTALILVVAAFYGGFRFWVTESPPAESIPPSVQILGTRLIGRKDGARQWEILANSVLQADNLVTLRDMDEITIFQTDESALAVTAALATWDRKLDRLELKGDVEVSDGADFRLQSELLVWQGSNETLVSPDPVVIHWNGLRILAGQMVLEVTQSLLRLSEGVEIYDGPFVWKLQQASYDLDQDVMDFYGTLVLEAEVGNNEPK